MKSVLRRGFSSDSSGEYNLLIESPVELNTHGKTPEVEPHMSQTHINELFMLTNLACAGF